MKQKTKNELEKIVNEYDTVIKVVNGEAHQLDESGERSYGGYIRATKGKLLEYLTKRLIEISWCVELEQNEGRLEINSSKIAIPINQEYLLQLPHYQQKYIKSHLSEYHYGLSVDRQIYIDGQLITGIECKAYTENAMLKKILVDFRLLKTLFPRLNCRLFQFESMLGGDYSSLLENGYGSPVSHTIMSYFPDVKLQILTFMSG